MHQCIDKLCADVLCKHCWQRLTCTVAPHPQSAADASTLAQRSAQLELA